MRDLPIGPYYKMLDFICFVHHRHNEGHPVNANSWYNVTSGDFNTFRMDRSLISSRVTVPGAATTAPPLTGHHTQNASNSIGTATTYSKADAFKKGTKQDTASFPTSEANQHQVPCDDCEEFADPKLDNWNVCKVDLHHKLTFNTELQDTDTPVAQQPHVSIPREHWNQLDDHANQISWAWTQFDGFSMDVWDQLPDECESTLFGHSEWEAPFTNGRPPPDIGPVHFHHAEHGEKQENHFKDAQEALPPTQSENWKSGQKSVKTPSCCSPQAASALAAHRKDRKPAASVVPIVQPQVIPPDPSDDNRPPPEPPPSDPLLLNLLQLTPLDPARSYTMNLIIPHSADSLPGLNWMSFTRLFNTPLSLVTSLLVCSFNVHTRLGTPP